MIRPRRLYPLLVAALVLGGWFGLPAVDALLYHQGYGQATETGSTFTAEGGPVPHALRCVLERGCPGPRLLTHPQGGASISDQLDPAGRPLHAPVPRSQARRGISRLRSPPTLHA